MVERLSESARKILALANQEAQRLNHEYIGTEHILLGMIKEGSNVGAVTLKEKGIDLTKARKEVEKLVRKGPEGISTMGKLPQTPRAKQALIYALEELQKDGNASLIEGGHMLLGILREERGVATEAIMSMEQDPISIRRALYQTLRIPVPNNFPPEFRPRPEIVKYLEGIVAQASVPDNEKPIDWVSEIQRGTPTGRAIYPIIQTVYDTTQTESTK